MPTYGNLVCISLIYGFKWSISIDVARSYQIRNQNVQAVINKVLWFRPMVVDQVISQRHDMNRNDFAPQLVYCHSNVNNDL